LILTSVFNIATQDEDIKGLLASSVRWRRIMLDGYFDSSEARAGCNEEEAKYDRCNQRMVIAGINEMVIGDERDVNDSAR
jgi:hypothetical protein